MSGTTAVGHTALRRKLNTRHIFTSSLGGCVGVGLLAWLSAQSGTVFLMPPFGATCVIAFVIPKSAYAQPYNIIGGHILSSFIGLLCLALFGNAWWSYALAVGSAMALMQFARMLHPPAAADPVLLIMQNTLSWDYLFTPVLTGSLILVLAAALIHNLIAHRHYPRYAVPPGWAHVFRHQPNQ